MLHQQESAKSILKYSWHSLAIDKVAQITDSDLAYRAGSPALCYQVRSSERRDDSMGWH